MLAMVTCSSGQNNAATPPIKLRASISVIKNAFDSREVQTLAVSFVVINDGQAAVDPGIGSSRLFINGVEPPGWNLTINNGIRTSYFESLPPGKMLSFNYQLGPSYFSKPGTYTVRWESTHFSSAPITFRVLQEGNWY